MKKLVFTQVMLTPQYLMREGKVRTDTWFQNMGQLSVNLREMSLLVIVATIFFYNAKN